MRVVFVVLVLLVACEAIAPAQIRFRERLMGREGVKAWVPNAVAKAAAQSIWDAVRAACCAV